MNKVVRNIILSVILFSVYIGFLIFLAGRQSDYRVILETEKEQYVFSADENEYTIDVSVKNKTNRLLRSADGFYLSYHLYEKDGITEVTYENYRSELSKALFTGDRCIVPMQVAHLEPGEYVIGIDIVQEYVAWFSEYEDTEKKIQIRVE